MIIFNKLKLIANHLRASFWFLPALMIFISMILAISLLEIDSTKKIYLLEQWPQIFKVDTDSARIILSTLAGSMLSIMGVTLSITLVALTLASSQYTSRVLRNFMRSRITQITFGTFASIALYCLVVLRAVRSSDGYNFVPHLSIFSALVFAFFALGILIYFIHHIALSIQASMIIAEIARETKKAIDQFFSKINHANLENHPKSLDDQLEKPWFEILSKKDGYVQSINIDLLMETALEEEMMIKMERSVGDFVVDGYELASIDQKNKINEKLISKINQAYTVSAHRTIEEDPTYGVRQIVDIALKALSPGVNETSTAVICIDYLTTILRDLLIKDPCSQFLYDQNQLRVIVKTLKFHQLLELAFGQIRRNSENNYTMIARMIGSLKILSQFINEKIDFQAIQKQLELIKEITNKTIQSDQDQQKIHQKILELSNLLDSKLSYFKK